MIPLQYKYLETITINCPFCKEPMHESFFRYHNEFSCNNKHEGRDSDYSDSIKICFDNEPGTDLLMLGEVLFSYGGYAVNAFFYEENGEENIQSDIYYRENFIVTIHDSDWDFYDLSKTLEQVKYLATFS